MLFACSLGFGYMVSVEPSLNNLNSAEFGLFYFKHYVVLSFWQVESNGTVLSTNWKDVGSKKVEGSAPDGMEMRKWEY